jgi:hypothetical protein
MPAAQATRADRDLRANMADVHQWSGFDVRHLLRRFSYANVKSKAPLAINSLLVVL